MKIDTCSRLFNKVCRVFYDNGIIHACLPASIILCEMLISKGIDAELRIGFATETELINMAYRHVWVVVGEKCLDIGLEITRQTYPNYPSWYQLTATLPIDKGIKRLDMETKEGIEALNDFELALNDIRRKGTKVYWKKYATPKLRRMRNELFRCMTHEHSRTAAY